MNEAESTRLAAGLRSRGYTPAVRAEEADLILLNSCVVRASAEKKVINRLAALRNLKKTQPEITIALTGCLVDTDTRSLQKRFPQVDYFFGPGAAPPFLRPDASEPVLPEHPPVSVNVPIMQGCNNFCTYCIVPYRRGRERSRTAVEVTGEIRSLVKRGVKEVTLLGQNVDAYGKDRPEGPDLAGLLREVNGIDGLERIRFLTSHPRDMSEGLIAAVANLGKVCRVVSLPVQAGSDAVLQAMRRGYTREDYITLVNRIRERIPDVTLSTDIIVGFPGESEEQFLESYDLLEELQFDSVHIAAYSPRPGTYAAEHLADDILPDNKKRRVNAIEELQTRVAARINAALLGTTADVLVAGRKKLKWYGRTRSDKLVFFNSAADCTGRVVAVEITHTSPWSLSGQIVGFLNEQAGG